MICKKTLLFISVLYTFLSVSAQDHKAPVPVIFNHADSLRGSVGPARSWWDVLHYNLDISLDINNKALSGSNLITFKTIRPEKTMQIDLQWPLKMDSVIYHGRHCTWQRDSNVYMVLIGEGSADKNGRDSIKVYYSGQPRVARMPPWDGGIVWKTDAKGRPWVGVACQGIGASVWWPCKDHPSDEPNLGARIAVTIPDTLVNISNGRLLGVRKNKNRTTTWTYTVVNPINTYDITLNTGKYISIRDSFQGIKGKLNIEYNVLDYNLQQVSAHLRKDVKTMLPCFEYWFGAYPFYEDGYRLVETDYLGMEHQSCIAYGNGFKKGYMGMDRSGTGIGMFWDFIIIHESGHEWFGNNISADDVADEWFQEAFTTYSEALYIECMLGKDSAAAYVRGLRNNILNDRPVTGIRGVHKSGSSDMYDKGANLIHTLRQVINNDSMFRAILLELNRRFAKSTVSSAQVESLFSTMSRKNLAPVFNQYLRNTAIPEFQYRYISNNRIMYRWQQVGDEFNMPVRLYFGKSFMWLYPNTAWQQTDIPDGITMTPDANFYIQVKELQR